MTKSISAPERRWILPAAEPFVGTVGAAINRNYLVDETQCVRALADQARVDTAQRGRIATRARRLIETVRSTDRSKAGLDAFLSEYDLSSREGVILMCLAEALLRVPDDHTADKLIADKIAGGNWAEHLSDASSLFVNASTWGLMLTGRIVRASEVDGVDPRNFIERLAGKLTEPVVRSAFRQAMRIMGHQFVMGRTIEEALQRSQSDESRNYRHSFDMLGESALSAADAQRYFDAYQAAIQSIAKSIDPASRPFERPSISVKLSALHPRYEFSHRRRVLDELSPRLEALAVLAQRLGVPMTIDAEEAERLELSLELIEGVCRSPALQGWNGFGLAVQAYQKRAADVVDWLVALAASTQRVLNIRLVKGAYWDSEIKRAQERGLDGYPVFTRKVNTDVSYLACARKLMAAARAGAIYAQFATHNAYTVATLLELTNELKLGPDHFEFQRLHGMGEELYSQLVGARASASCRVYAPVGSHEELLPYLVRRLLENGANTSFVNRLVDEHTSIESLIADPVSTVDQLAEIPHPRIVLPVDIYRPERMNSQGLNLSDGRELEALAMGLSTAGRKQWQAASVVGGKVKKNTQQPVRNPARWDDVVGFVLSADEKNVERAFAVAADAQPQWNSTGAARRADILLKAAQLYEEYRAELISLCVREGGRTIGDSLSEVREAVDFLRYYAEQARATMSEPRDLPGPTGEQNRLGLAGRGVFVCISPWNFPLAIFTGQIAAALAAGNAVIAKPAEQTPLIAARTVELLHAAGVPDEVLHYMPGDGAVGARAVADLRTAGVAFTGSTEVAKAINRSLATREGPIPVLIAETGGQNALIADSSALPEQVVLDAVQSGFNSAGQRCSALRVLFVQEDIAARVLKLLAGFMDELNVSDPALLSTDIGPVIDTPAREALREHVDRIARQASWTHQSQLGADTDNGSFFAPRAFEIDSLSRLTREVFGPVLHIVRFAGNKLNEVVDAINGTGYGLTLGIHSRIDATVRDIVSRARVGNIYVNRNIIGAVVGVQPFGGRGLSGTGPKAGGPHYLPRFTSEYTVTVNTSAVGGNATLLSLEG